ncbi:MAG: hypothetical protein EOP06_27890 [Proteobacteria bacterium]|nr:MAG: hypothetical protein EOP06_27890 [Pseudomonadota bacterium]
MKTIILYTLLSISLNAFGQKSLDTRIIVTVEDSIGIYEKVRMALVEEGFIIVDNRRTDSISTQPFNLKSTTYLLTYAAIKDNTVTIWGYLADANTNMFAGRDEQGLSSEGRSYVAGLLEHAADFAAFAAPTINAYKRFRINSLAPDRIAWARDNRGAMLRVIDQLSPAATRVENRVGEPSANPYLYIFSQALAGLAGIDAKMTLPEPVETPYSTDAQRLPRSLDEAVSLLDKSAFARASFGDDFVDYFVMIKRFEIARFFEAVTDWEHREYFDMH